MPCQTMIHSCTRYRNIFPRRKIRRYSDREYGLRYIVVERKPGFFVETIGCADEGSASLNAAKKISRSNDSYDALPSSAHPMVLNNGTAQEKTISVRPPTYTNFHGSCPNSIQIARIFTPDLFFNAFGL